TVFDDEHHYRDVAVRLTSGAFRFVTGHSEKAAYKITTPLATIGVRGTVLDILSPRGQTIVVLQDGASTVCTSSRQCIDLT
ncbi:FecR family protein, partial [Pseudomonas syringae pv. actinidiae]|nr:FecR family protein [Pseudomonas syringae pv. actinidiae]